MALVKISVDSGIVPAKVRATKEAPESNANAHGSTGCSTTPRGVALPLVPFIEVGELWPVVRP